MLCSMHRVGVGRRALRRAAARGVPLAGCDRFGPIAAARETPPSPRRAAAVSPSAAVTPRDGALQGGRHCGLSTVVALARVARGLARWPRPQGNSVALASGLIPRCPRTIHHGLAPRLPRAARGRHGVALARRGASPSGAAATGSGVWADSRVKSVRRMSKKCMYKKKTESRRYSLSLENCDLCRSLLSRRRKARARILGKARNNRRRRFTSSRQHTAHCHTSDQEQV